MEPMAAIALATALLELGSKLFGPVSSIWGKLVDGRLTESYSQTADLLDSTIDDVTGLLVNFESEDAQGWLEKLQEAKDGLAENDASIRAALALIEQFGGFLGTAQSGFKDRAAISADVHMQNMRSKGLLTILLLLIIPMGLMSCATTGYLRETTEVREDMVLVVHEYPLGVHKDELTVEMVADPETGVEYLHTVFFEQEIIPEG